MRILLVSDIHSNWPALAAITEPYDVALFLGDLVEYGVEPAPCIEWVRSRCQYRVRGNHDHSAAQNVAPPTAQTRGFKWLTAVTRAIGIERLSEPDRRFLATLPLTQYLRLDERKMLLVHATPRDPLDEYAPADEAFWTRRLEGVDAEIICVGHTHQPYAFEVAGKLVINPGSVGLQREGDPRVSYAILDGSQVLLRRIEYPIEQTVAAVEATNLPDEVKSLLINVYREGRLPMPTPPNGMMIVQPNSPAPGQLQPT
ncbi:MAG: metallophosphoesterase family protein [Gemmataceae bacterium]